MSEFAGKHVLIIVENLPVPFDRRVWQEARALLENGAEVSIICPQMKGYTKSFEQLDGINIYRHPLPIEAKSAIGYLLEYSIAMFFQFIISVKIFIKHRFDVIHGCNPPDLIFVVALPFKLFGVKYVFDHHDVNPELYIAKFGEKNALYHAMIWLERLTFKFADYSIATNSSYRDIAIRRGGMNPDKVQVVRSGTDLDRIKLQPPIPDIKEGKSYLIGYVGVIGEQEGLDLLMESVKHLKSTRNDFHVAILGGGTDLEKIKTYASELNVGDVVTFYGRVPDQTLLDVLNTADICVNPDKPSEMNNISTMNKIMEYMALEKPIVQYTLLEGRESANEASLYAKNTDPIDFAEKIAYLLDHPEERKRMGMYGRKRVLETLSWEHEKRNLMSIYRKVFS